MDTFLIEVPMPSMGATVHELTVISLRIQPGAQVTKGQKIAELESDKSVFEFESPCDGTIRAVLAKAGEVKATGTGFLRIDTSDESLRHLAAKPGGAADAGDRGQAEAVKPAKLSWTPRALKIAQEAGLDPEKITDIDSTGPGGRVSGDDIARYLQKRKSA